MVDRLDRYNITWTSPSADATGSMPIGNGDLAANVWVEQATGDLLILLAKHDAFDENANLLKVGRIRVSFSPNPGCDPAVEFRQTLCLRDASLHITALAGGLRLAARLHVDLNRPVLVVDIEASAPVGVVAAVEMWRTEPRPIKTQTGDLFKNLVGKNADPYPTVVQPDEWASHGNAVAWCHHNRRLAHDGYEINLRLQGLAAALHDRPHPLVGRTFGAAVTGDGFHRSDHATLRAGASTSHRLLVWGHTAHPATVDAWRRQVAALAEAPPGPIDWARHRADWQAFWERSWIEVIDAASPDSDATDAFRVTRAYLLQRYLTATGGGRGAFPIKHNGGLFSVGRGDDPDFRRWGPGYWFQNQRLIYWPMLAGGDFDLLQPFFTMYRQCLDLQRLRAQTHFGHGGANYPETIYFWGGEASAHYGWTPFEQRARPEAECPYVTYHWCGGIELALMLLERYERSPDDGFAAQYLVPITSAILEFYDLHYPREPGGVIRFSPAQALETWHDATNPTPEIAGLHYLIRRWLAAFPSGSGLAGTAEVSARAQMLRDQLPQVPTGERDGRRVILPAEQFDRKKNTENPELYAVFPFRLFGVGMPDLRLARDTFAARLHVEHTCWHQDAIQMACLGLAEEARASLAIRASPQSHSESRFPGFWNAFHDWIPDLDHGGVLQIALQMMLMQCAGRQIRLLPAWPEGWNADFRLHAPGPTVVQARVVDGALTDLVVTPSDRRRDVVIGGDGGASVG